MRNGSEDGTWLAAHARARVLVVDDEPTNRSLLEFVLNRAGVREVVSVGDPRDVVAQCLDNHVDLVLLDLNMPQMSGFEVLAQLRERLPVDTFLPVVVLTGDDSGDNRSRALQAGATDFVTKPFDVTEIVLRVRNLLDAKALHTQVQRYNEVLESRLEERERVERERAEHRRRVLARIADALDERSRRTVYQPIADLRTGEVVGFEALARFSGQPNRPPNEWFEEAASVGCGVGLELAAARTALGALDQLAPGAFLSVNCSPSTTLDPGLMDLLTQMPPDRVVLELTEHDPVDDYGPLLGVLERLRAHGVRVAIDDAGAGYSGLQHVLRLRPDVLKLDVALTRDIDSDPDRRALATAMVAFASEIGAVVIAEGIETAAELRTLRDLGVPLGQGYHLARPGALPLTATSIPA
ncbi:MAG TPA: EAL domain-containing protein [Egicoccus sp.]|nr:EAL domain-containing protein [Egicoccus sp.]HSK25117.1 EAL domain-containing protein [Egicoccus sp.]